MTMRDAKGELRAIHAGGRPIVMVTAYDVVTARAAEAGGVDVVLVGDSGANVVLGYDTTREVSLDEMLVLTRAARRGCTTPLLVGDLPFGTYEDSDAQAVATARRFVREGGCDLVKLEGGGAMATRAFAIVEAGIPVMGHVGLLPQGARSPEELRAKGRTAEEAVQIARDAESLERAGCCSIVFEAIPAALTDLLVARLGIPVIGIGAGAGANGQVLVIHDLLGMSASAQPPRFVKRYASVARDMAAGVAAFAREVRSREYPLEGHTYRMDPVELEKVRQALDRPAS